MVKFENGKIYKIISNSTDDIYVGSTTKLYLSQRMSKHRSHYRSYLKDGKGYVSSFELLKHNDCSIILIENYPCNTKDELRAREQYWIDQIDCVNKVNAYGISKESQEHTKQYRKTYGKQYREKNKEIISEKSKEYRKKIKEKKKHNDKEYREKNKEMIAQKKKEWYEKHKNEINEKRRLEYLQNKQE